MLSSGEAARAGERSNVLAVYLEPAPYIVGLVAGLRRAWRGRVDALYVSDRMTQSWGDWRPGSGDDVLPKGGISAVSAILRRLTTERYAVVHLAGWGHPLLLATLVAARLLGIPVTVESDTPAGQATSLWKRIVKAAIYPRLFRLPAVFLPGGSRQAAYLSGFGVPRSKIRIAAMTVDVAAISSFVDGLTAERRERFAAEYGLNGDAVRFLYLGRLEPHKGIVDLLDAFGALRSEVRGVELMFAGSGRLQPAVTAAAAGGRGVRYLGHLSGERVWEAYAMADVFVLPSCFEPWGLVVNEAMAAGLPVIVTDRVGCADDLVRQGETGLITPAGAPDRLSAAMQTLALDPSTRRRMGLRARDLIAPWTLDATAQVTAQAWREAMS